MKKSLWAALGLAVFVTACASGGSSAGRSPENGLPSDNGIDPVNGTLAAQYPGDVGIGDDPDVVWYEPFEQEEVSEFVERYDQVRSVGMTFWSEHPALSPGNRSLRLEAGGSMGSATDAYTRLPGDGYERLFLRYYARHEDASYHHTGVWIGGYNPLTAWPQGGAGSRPNGNDRITIAIEPMGAVSGGLRLDFYNYWMRMRSCRTRRP